MKTTVVLLALVATIQTAHAQSLRPETATGAILGGIAGGVIGHNSGHDSWKGAAIGTVVGGLLGSSAADSRERYYSHQVPVPHPAHYGRYNSNNSYRYSPSYRYGYDHSGYSRPYSTYYYSEPAYHSPGSNSRASTGLLLGGIAGAIIGHNSGDLRNNAWRGAAIGAGSGLILGSIADHRARERAREREIVYQSTAPDQTAPAAPAQTVPQTVIINNNYYGTPSTMTPANSLFGR